MEDIEEDADPNTRWVLIGVGLLVLSSMIPAYIRWFPGILLTGMFWGGLGLILIFGAKKALAQ
jgi:hypothetical protein